MYWKSRDLDNAINLYVNLVQRGYCNEFRLSLKGEKHLIFKGEMRKNM